MNQLISQKYQRSESLLLISGSIVDVMNNFKNITKQNVPVLFLVNLSEYSNILEKINGFSNLNSNWDSYNAETISDVAIELAKETLDYLNFNGLLSSEMTTNLFPMRDGGIQFEFDGENLVAELEISPNAELTLIHFDDDGDIIGEPQKLFELSELSTLLEEAQYA